MQRTPHQIGRDFGRDLLATERPAPPWGASCRVCGGRVEPGEPVLFRAWGVEYACRKCGWLRPSETAPHLLSGSELRAVYWEWACSTCRRDVIAEVRPAEAGELRCPGCQRQSAAIAAPAGGR